MAQENTEKCSCGGEVPVGGTVTQDGDIEFNIGRTTLSLEVSNTGDRPVQVGSHFHFFEVNRYLSFDRERAFGFHLNIPATTAIRFEPGEKRTVELVAYGGRRRVVGFGGLTNGYTGSEDAPHYLPKKSAAIARAKSAKYKFGN